MLNKSYAMFKFFKKTPENDGFTSQLKIIFRK